LENRASIAQRVKSMPIAPMKHRFFASDRPRVLAHRGGAALAPENTIAAFDQGLALGADGLELDVQLSRDGVVVVHHDLLLDRTTNLRGPITARTADELSRADAAWHFRQGDEFPFRGRGIGVPTLAEVLARYPNIPVVIELKESSATLAQAVVAAVRAAGAVDRVCVGAFEIAGLREVRRIEPAIATSAARVEVIWTLLQLWCRCPPRAGLYSGFQVPELAGRTRVVSPRFVEAAHRGGLGVQVWTINSVAAATRLLGAGVDALITDRPDLMVPLCRG
jgi:glycerophosphoryl diester phosphodiesterase